MMRSTESDLSAFWQTFRHGTAVVDGVHLHYVAGCSGAPVLLLPGWPQSWYAWRFVMVRLAAAGRRVVALDPRGMGESDRPAGGYDLTTVAADIHALAEKLGLLADGPIDVVGHDVGTWIGYAYAADWPDDVRRLAVLDALVPGLSSPRTDLAPDEANLRTWHFAFNRLDDLPEILIAGREPAFLTWLFRAKAINAWAIGPDDIDEYARQLAAPGAIRAATAYYKAAFSPEGLAANRARGQRPLPMPVLALGAERGVGQGMVEAMRSLGSDVQGGVVAGCGHYMPEESPDEVSGELIRFFSDVVPGAQ
ncbi:alpha/beta fold hydrolase [Bradyrhizobium sp. HKCCYLS1011]|uniref:alpha/beta fold hydrolase n=1 Tax=Bradyrhizobium sp. HKCCYLS1011 TaxID=3420733 RepID=UPI003EB89A84